MPNYAIEMTWECLILLSLKKKRPKKKTQTQGWLQQHSDSELEHPVGKFKQYLKQPGVVLLLRFIAVASSL